MQGAAAAAGDTAMTPHGQRLATAGQRIGARLIDTVISIAIAIPVFAAIFGSGLGEFNFGVLLLGIAFSFAYEAAMVALKGGSLGKLILGLAIVREGAGHHALDPKPGRQYSGHWLPDLLGRVRAVTRLVVQRPEATDGVRPHRQDDGYPNQIITKPVHGAAVVRNR
jgi:hypothetical protein